MRVKFTVGTGKTRSYPERWDNHTEEVENQQISSGGPEGVQYYRLIT